MNAAEGNVNVNGVRLWTLRQGSGPPIVLLHGGPGLYDYFDGLGAMLDDSFEVHRYDQRGGGQSERVGPYDVATFVADLDALRAHWGHARWIVAGHSWGASLAIAYAVEHPDRVRALVQIDGTGLIKDWQDEYRARSHARRTPAQRARRAELGAILEDEGALSDVENREYCVLTWQSDFADRSRAQEYAGYFLRPYAPSYDVNTAVNEDWSRMLADPTFVDAASRIEAPALVMHGALDPRPARLAERLAASLPNARFVIIPKSGHSPWIEQPEATHQALRQFLAGVEAQPSVVAT